MADSLRPLPVNCSSCGRSVQYRRVKSNENGNQGRLLARVSSVPTTNGSNNTIGLHRVITGEQAQKIPEKSEKITVGSK
jgi:hypothetical protein